jgi:hypothetical protein
LKLKEFKRAFSRLDHIANLIREACAEMHQIVKPRNA